MFFAATVAVALLTSQLWKREAEIPDGLVKPASLRTFSLITVALVVAQIALGAAVRHKVMGAGLHITFAMLVALAIVILGVLVTNQCPTHRTLRPTAVAMMVIAGAQVFLGFGAFIVRMMADENTLPVRIATMAHVTTGALTLASTVVLALEIRRNLRVTAAVTEGERRLPRNQRTLSCPRVNLIQRRLDIPDPPPRHHHRSPQHQRQTCRQFRAPGNPRRPIELRH